MEQTVKKKKELMIDVVYQNVVFYAEFLMKTGIEHNGLRQIKNRNYSTS